MSVENGVDVYALLHGDYTELVLFVDPNKEGLFLVVEDSVKQLILHIMVNYKN
jgi:hypothetical protein